MKILIIGYGSIGKRHAANTKAAGHEVVLLRHSTRNPNNDGFKECYSFQEAITSGKISGAIVCSPTSRHLSDVEQLVKHRVPFLLEKPPAVDLRSTLSVEEVVRDNGFTAYDIGFNMRYYPPFQFIKNFLPQLGRIYSARIAAGYYLPNWRNDVDYRDTSSASRELGGGVHIELVHEIDYLVWFFGCPERVTGYISRISNLEIATEDICAALLKYQDGSVIELHLDYLSHKYLRTCQIIAEKGTLAWDMNSGNVQYFRRNREKAEEIFSLDPHYDFNDTYVGELENFIRIIGGRAERQVSIAGAVNTMRVLEAIKLASEKENWIYLKNV